MLNLEFIINNPYFEKVTLEKSRVLFDEGDIDNNIYVLISGSLSIHKYTTSEKTNSKQLAVLNKGAIFGEGALKDCDPKQVKIQAIENSELYKINAEIDIKKFITEFPTEGIEFLTEIIDISNKRLLESNFLVTSNYQMSKIISEVELYDNKHLFEIIEEFKKTISAEYIIYLETNPVLDNYLTLKYDSRITGKMQNIVIQQLNEKLQISTVQNEGIKLEEFNLVEELITKNKNIGYLIIGLKNSNFNDGQKKAITSISALIAGAIKQKQAYEEERNRDFNK